MDKHCKFSDDTKKHDGLNPISQCADDILYYTCKKGLTKNALIRIISNKQDVFKIINIFEIIFDDLINNPNVEMFRIQKYGGGRLYQIHKIFSNETSHQRGIYRLQVLLQRIIYMLENVN
tara:strand:- start:2744 stop:3103 length:360 start_codon:yes stop_codon:yes gene_type:complete